MFFIFSIFGENFPIEAHYKNVEELVPKHPPDGIMCIWHQVYFYGRATVTSIFQCSGPVRGHLLSILCLLITNN